jgi:hypothetical protein
LTAKRITWTLGSGALAIGALVLYRQLAERQTQASNPITNAANIGPNFADTREGTRAVSNALAVRLEASFRDVYLQLLSVIQGVAFGFLATTTILNVT